MKKALFTALILLLSINRYASSSENKQKDDANIRMNQLRNEVLINLTQNILPYWSTRMVDTMNGGFYGRINSSDKVFPAEDKGGVLNARILWTFSSAYRILRDTSYLRLATRSKNYIMAHFIDKKYGGAYLSVKSNGEASDTRKQIYTQSFFIYGLAEYYRATGDTEALEAARGIFELIERNALDKKSGGYFEVYSRDWHRLRDRLIGESTKDDEKTMNTHLHVMEAYTNLYRVWPDKNLGESLKKIVDLFLDKIIDAETSHLICFMDSNWNRTSSVDSYGHDIESSWLLPETAGLLNDPALLERVKNASIKIANAAKEGIQVDGSLIYEKDQITGRSNTERSWWAEAETIIGYFNAYELTGNEEYLANSENCWNYTKTHLVDNKAGGWFSSVSESGAVSGDKGGFWVCPYHNSRMCMEIIERLAPH